MEIKKYLDDLERRIDPAAEDALHAEWEAFTDGRFAGDIFLPRRRQKAAPGCEWPKAPVNDAIEDVDMMALQQFGDCSQSLTNGSGGLLAIRCNYGTGIMPSLFGARLFVMDREMNTLPTTKPLDGRDEIRRILDAGIPDLHGGLGGKTLAMGARFVEIMSRYPKISRYVHLYHPDVQGPMDVCELLWGSSLFLDVVDFPDLVKSLLELVTETYVRFMRKWNETAPPPAGHAVHWSLMHKGAIMLRDDSAMNFSPEMCREFIEPYDRRLLQEFGGGALHFCGRGDHYIARIPEMGGLYGVAMSQPEYNNMETIYRHTVDKGIPLLGFRRETADQAIRSGRNLRGRVHCW